LLDDHVQSLLVAREQQNMTALAGEGARSCFTYSA
jgi:hypothetical protein